MLSTLPAPSRRRRTPALAVLAALALALLAAPPGTLPATAATRAEVDDAMRAVDSLSTVVRRDPNNGFAHLRLGVALTAVGRLADAEQAYRKADALGFARLIARYNVAALAARQAHADTARHWLGLAFAAGYGNFEGLAADPDFASLAGDARYDTLVAGARRRAYPCEEDARFRAFDFWVGEWDVMANGIRVGTNTITRVLAGCALREEWRANPASGSWGESINRFDPATGAWRQLWIDVNGNQMDFTGHAFADSMRFDGRVVPVSGPQTRSAMTFTPLPDGTVRQLIRSAPLDRDEWTTAFDAIYVRQAKSSP